MKYKRFEDLPVWQKAMDLVENVYALLKENAVRSNHGICDQIGRAALSVSNNIAEGFERGTTAELLAFLYIARGSAGEVRSMLALMERLPDLSHLKSEISNLKLISESCSRQIHAWADSLQNSDIKGQRHLTAKSHELYKREKVREEFLKELKNVKTRSPGAKDE